MIGAVQGGGWVGGDEVCELCVAGGAGIEAGCGGWGAGGVRGVCAEEEGAVGGEIVVDGPEGWVEVGGEKGGAFGVEGGDAVVLAGWGEHVDFHLEERGEEGGGLGDNGMEADKVEVVGKRQVGDWWWVEREGVGEEGWRYVFWKMVDQDAGRAVVEDGEGGAAGQAEGDDVLGLHEGENVGVQLIWEVEE